MKKRRLAKLLSTVMIMAFLVSAGGVSCCPWAAPLPGPIPGGPLPGEQPPGGPAPGGPAPGGELQLVLVAQPDMVPQGGCAMLHWEVSPPGEYRVLVDGQEVPLVGEQQACPPGTTTYELLVETPSGPQVRTVTINVGGGPGGGPGPTPQGPGPQPTPGGPGPAPTGAPGEGCAGAPTFTYFTASASTISPGQQVQLSWGEVRNGTSGPLVGSVVLSPGGFGEVGSPGSRWASPTTTTTYRLTATGCGGTATKDVTVTVGGSGTAATATPHPGGPTATKPAAGPTATTQAPTPTATPFRITGTVVPFVPVPTATSGSTTAALQVTNGCGRTIYAVYVREAGESWWGTDRLGLMASSDLKSGEKRTIQLGPGSYEMRAECCSGLVVSEHSVSLSSGTYDWTVIAALDIHNSSGEQIEELNISGEDSWNGNLLETDAPWPGCGSYPHTIAVYDVLRCYLVPGTYSLRAVTTSGRVYEQWNADVQGNSAWYLNNLTQPEFWTPPED